MELLEGKKGELRLYILKKERERKDPGELDYGDTWKEEKFLMRFLS